jgi:DnaJ homolog subfamily C member 9
MANEGSDEERDDVLAAYVEGEGSVQFIMENIMACDFEDEPRFIKIVNEALEEGKVEKFPQWKKDTSAAAIKSRKRAAEKEAKEAEELSKEIGLKKSASKMDEEELGKLIRQRNQNSMDGLIATLEAQAQNGKKGGKRKAAASAAEPTDEEFEAAKKRIEGGKAGSKKRK